MPADPLTILRIRPGGRSNPAGGHFSGHVRWPGSTNPLWLSRLVDGLVALAPGLLLRLFLVFLLLLGDFALPLFERIVDLGQCAGPLGPGRGKKRAISM